jgi:hypothetical protein
MRSTLSNGLWIEESGEWGNGLGFFLSCFKGVFGAFFGFNGKKFLD